MKILFNKKGEKMFNFIEVEFLKLKHSKIFLLTLLGAIAVPSMMFLGLLYRKANYPEDIITLQSFLYEINFLFLGLFVVMLFCLIIGYLITREYNEHTLKSILTFSISRTKYLVGKYLMSFIWILIVTLVAFLASIVFALIGGVSEVSLNIIMKMFYQYMLGSAILFLSMSPFVFISLIFKNVVPTVIGGSFIFISNSLLFEQDFAPLSPWLSPYLLVSGKISEYSYGTTLPILIIIATLIIGFLLSWIYFNKKDIPL